MQLATKPITTTAIKLATLQQNGRAPRVIVNQLS